MSAPSKAFFHNERAAFAKLESVLWPDSPVCPHRGGVERITFVKGGRTGLKRCGPCRMQFTVIVGTIFEASHVKLHLWRQAVRLMCSSKKGISSHQIHRILGVMYKTAWFMTHRIREAMREGKLPAALGGENRVVEADETYIGGKAKNRAFKEPRPKEAAFVLVERDGRVRSFHVQDVSAKTLRPILRAQLDRNSFLMAGEAPVYRRVGRDFGRHGTVNHSVKEYVRGSFHHTNTVENYFSILKRGITGTYHHVSQQHLKRYLAEFDFHYNERVALGVNDEACTTRVLRGIVGKRLTYRDSSSPA